jgi:hypothetical protein
MKAYDIGPTGQFSGPHTLVWELIEEDKCSEVAQNRIPGGNTGAIHHGPGDLRVQRCATRLASGSKMPLTPLPQPSEKLSRGSLRG